MQSLEPLSYFFGAFLGDGWFGNHNNHGRIAIRCQDKDIVQRCYFDVTYYFSDLRRARLPEMVTSNGTILYEVCWNGRGLFDFVNQAVGEKEYFPSYIWHASRESKLDFLAGLMDTDGTIAINRSYAVPSYSCKFTGGKPFVRYFPYLCQLLDIKVSNIKRDLRKQNPCYDFWLRKESLRKSGFNFYCDRKRKRFDTWMNGATDALYGLEPGFTYKHG